MEKDVEQQIGQYLVTVIGQITRRNDIPDCVIDEIVTIKNLVDRIDGRISVVVIAAILLNAGFNIETGKYNGEDDVKDAPEPAENLGTEAKNGEDEAVQADKAAQDIKNKEFEEAVSDNIPNDTKVEFMLDGALIKGVIVKSRKNGDDVVYDIEIDGVTEPYTNIPEADVDTLE